MLDLDYAEDSEAETDANFVMTGTGGIVEIQGDRRGRAVQRGGVRARCWRSPAAASPSSSSCRSSRSSDGRPTTSAQRGDTLVVATHNPGKLREIADLLAPVRPGGGRRPPTLGLPEPEETGTTFEENAALKARRRGDGRRRCRRSPTIPASCVDALGGAPGIYSARWAGPAKDFGAAMRAVEDELAALGATTPEQRRAAFVAVLCLAWPDGASETFRGEVDGTLVWPPRGDARLRLRPDVPARRLRPHLRRDDGRGEAWPPTRLGRPVAPRPRLRALRPRKAGRRMSESEPGFGVYVHWPFCAAKCPYCDFNSHVRHQPPDQARFAAAFAREIATTAARAPGRTVTSIFLGGGTPSLMEPATVGADPRRGRRSTGRSPPDAEVTLEANPSSVEAERFRGYRAAGVNRVSLGVQALNDADLQIPRPAAQCRGGAARRSRSRARPSRGSPST